MDVISAEKYSFKELKGFDKSSFLNKILEGG